MIVVLALPVSTFAQATTTLLVAQFSQRENQVFAAIQKHDSAALEKLLAHDFVEWTPAPEPSSRQDWVGGAMKSSLRSFRMRQMSVQMVDNTAVVNFMLDRTGNDTGQFFIVDLWKQQGNEWQLATRYQAKVSSQPQPGSRQPPIKE